jgi:hypothetical protein
MTASITMGSASPRRSLNARSAAPSRAAVPEGLGGSLPDRRFAVVHEVGRE